MAKGATKESECSNNAEPKKPKKTRKYSKYSYWKATLPMVYDCITHQHFNRPLLSCRWGPCLKPTKRSYNQRLYFSEQADGIVPNTLVIADCNFEKPNVAIPEHMYHFDKKGRSPFCKVVKTIRHPGEVKRIREFPQYQSIVATHTDSPKVLIWDIQAQPDRHDAPVGAAVSCADLVLEGHTSNAESALAMCSTQPYVLSGGKDKSVVLWSLQDHISTLAGGDSTNRAISIVKTADSASLSPRGIFQGHTDTVEDVQFHPKSSQEFCSVGADSCLILWDERGGKLPITKVEKAHNLDVHCVDWNRLDDNYILTGSADKSVCMFDRRKLSSAGVGASVYQFMEHKAPVSCVQWCPDKSSVFGSSAEDGRVNIWDHKQVGRTTEHGAGVPAGLFFKHCGHRAQVTDFHWNDHAPWTIVSVSPSYDAELDNAESHDAESNTESDDDDAESGYPESDDDDDAESGYTESDDDDAEPDDDEPTSGGGTLQIWRMHSLAYKAVLNNTS